MTGNGMQRLSASLVHHALLGSSIPALVHRANNCLSVIDGTLELAEGLDPEERKLAQEQSSLLRDLLRHLGFHARHDLEEGGAHDLIQVLAEVESMLALVGRFHRCEVELRTSVGSAEFLGDRAGLYRVLVSLGLERISALYRTEVPGCVLRLSLSVRGGTGRLLMVDAAGAFPFDTGFWEGLAAEAGSMAAAGGLSLACRRSGGAHAIRIDLPLENVTRVEEDPEDPLRSDRILLVQPGNDEAELFVALLSERGYHVEHQEECRDGAGRFDLVLCDEVLLPSLPPVEPPVLVLGNAGSHPRIFGCVSKPVRPQELLDRIGAALL